RVRTTAAAMETIANHIGRVPGRKNLIWITGSFPFTIGQRGAEGPSAWTVINDAAAQPNIGKKRKSGDSGEAKTDDSSAAYGIYGADLPGPQPGRESFAAFDEDIGRAARALNNSNIAVY